VLGVHEKSAGIRDTAQPTRRGIFARGWIGTHLCRRESSTGNNVRCVSTKGSAYHRHGTDKLTELELFRDYRGGGYMKAVTRGERQDIRLGCCDLEEAFLAFKAR